MKDGFITYANSFQAVSRLGLERIGALLRELGNPERRLHALHIAGTNGKGSVAAYLSAILTAAGYRTGLYTSPNLVKVSERIRISGEMISEAALADILARVEVASARVEQLLHELPTQFEIWTAAAFLYFADQEVDYVVLETGLGGEFDATNVILSNVMSIFTRIDLDHTQYLGNTVKEIARTKSKIIKDACESGVTVSAPQSAEVAEILLAESKKHGCRMIFSDPPPSLGFERIYERFFYKGMALAPSLGGIHQIENASVAVDAALALGIPSDAITEGVSSAYHPARMELLCEDPVMLYDGGHNPNGLTALSASLDRYYPTSEMTVIFAAMKDKDIAPSLALLRRQGRDFIFTTVQNNPRAMTPEELTERAASLGVGGFSAPTLGDAIRMAEQGGRMILICGSLYLYADLPERFKK